MTMYRLRSTRVLLLQRRLFLRGPLCFPAVGTANEADRLVPRRGARKRRYFSSGQHGSEKSSSSAATTAIADKNAEARNLESYTSYVLRSQRVPLGTVSSDEWDDVVAAASMWTTQMENKGLSIDNAERLLQRLQFEMITTSNAAPDVCSSRTAVLKELRFAVLQSWLELLKRHPSSTLALNRSESALWNVLEMDLGDGGTTSFPVEEMFLVMDRWLDQQTAEGALRASEFLLSCTTERFLPYLEEYSTNVNMRFDGAIASLLERAEYTKAQDLSAQLLDRMDFLKHEASWDRIELSVETQKALERAAFQSYDDISDTAEPAAAREHMTKATLSSFEAAAVANRLTEVLRKAGPDDREEIANKVIPRIDAMEDPSEQLIVCLLDYYLRIGDAPSASVWTPRLSTDVMLSRTSEDGSLSLADRLLDAWSLQKHPRAPWRAEEIFRQILDGANDGTNVPVSTMNRLLQIWSASSDPASNRKVREWFSRMTDTMNLKPDGESLHLVLQAMDGNSSSSHTLFERILEEWNTWEREEKQEIVDTLMEVLSKEKQMTPSALTLLVRIKNDGFELPRETYLPLLSTAFLSIDDDSVPETVTRLNDDSKKIDWALYEAAIRSLIKREGKQLGTVETLWQGAFQKLAADASTEGNSTEIADFLTGVMMEFAKWKHYGAGETFLNQAERSLAANEKSGSEKTWPIPLAAYKLLIRRNWYKAEITDKVISVCERLISLYKDGHVDLRPDKDVYLAYLRASTVVSDDPSDLVKILDEMASSYQEVPEESCKPHAEVFNVILLAMKNKIENPKAAMEASLGIWKRLNDLGVTPDTKTINLVMHSIIKGNSNKTTYSSITHLYSKFQEHGLEPDSHTYHLLISACGTARTLERDDALKLCLQAFGEIRRRGATTVFTYASLTKSLRRLLLGVHVPVADKVATRTLKLCYEDGLLAPEVREAYESMISKGVWKAIYAQHMSDANEEPEEWHRNLPNANRS